MLYRISVAERGLIDIANIFRSRLSGLDDCLRAGTVPLIRCPVAPDSNVTGKPFHHHDLMAVTNFSDLLENGEHQGSVARGVP